jgi:hypothetical protein
MAQAGLVRALHRNMTEMPDDPCCQAALKKESMGSDPIDLTPLITATSNHAINRV